jgi:hypothetical protein
MQGAIAVETPLGVIRGRDAIYLGAITAEAIQRRVTITGQIYGGLCSRNPEGWDWAYELQFDQVQAWRCVTLDLCDPTGKVASFEELVESEWMDELRKRDAGLLVDRVHYRVWTYDDTFEFICDRRFGLELRALSPQEQRLFIRLGNRPPTGPAEAR